MNDSLSMGTENFCLIIILKLNNPNLNIPCQGIYCSQYDSVMI